jgi:hypothetical protein
METGFSQKSSPFRKEDSERDSLTDRWPVAFNHVSGMPTEQLDRLERKLVQLRRGVGVTVSQMALLRAIAARRVAQHFEEVHRKARA